MNKTMIETLKFYKDFPKEGINFIDIIPFLQSRKAFGEVIAALNKATTAPNVAAPEARAFLFAAPLLTEPGVVENIIPMRKSGKLPFNEGDLIEVKIEKEYGFDRLFYRLSDIVAGVPDSGTPHAIGYANKSGIPFARAFIKYTPTWARSFTPKRQQDRNRIAKMKQIPINDLITDKKLLFVDDSIVRGTQLKETVDFLYNNGAKEVHMRSACPPIMYSCKYLSFSRNQSDLDLIARRVILELEGEDGFKYIAEYSDSSTERGKNLRKAIADKFKFASLEFQSLEGIVKAIGLPKEKLCTYCWDGKE